MKLQLYTREQCDLCEKAEALLAVAGLDDRYERVYIDEDVDLLSRYADQIPVVINPETGEKLSWPFTASQVRDIVEAG